MNPLFRTKSTTSGAQLVGSEGKGDLLYILYLYISLRQLSY